MKTVKLVSFYLLSQVMTSQGIIVNVLIVNACYKHYRLDKFPEAATGAVLVKGILKSVANLTGKHQCWNLNLGHQACNFIKKGLEVLSCEICEIFKNTCFEEHLRTTTSEFR